MNGYLQLRGNAILSDITGIKNINPSSINLLLIAQNSSLSECAVESICDYIAGPGSFGIWSNAPGCNNTQEVEDACDSIQTSLPLRTIHDKFMILPNPLESSSIILYSLEHESPVSLRILDISGRLVVSLINENQQQGEQKVIFNTDGLKAGVYFCTLKTKEGVQTRKVIKVE
jgi:hypothetical protein